MSRLTELHAYFVLAGIALLMIGVGHIALPNHLKWKQEFESVSLMTRQVSYVHTFFIGLTCVMFGAIDLLAYDELTTSTILTKLLLGFLSVFWLSRLIIQIFVFERSNWSTTLLKMAHLAAIALWTFLSLIHGIAFSKVI